MDTNVREAHALEQRVRKIVLSLPENSFLRQYVIYASQLTDCNVVYHLGGGLTILAQTVHDDLHFRLGSRLHGNIYALAVGPSTSSRKTASVQIARELIDEALPGQASKGPGSHEGLIDSLVDKSRQLLLYEEFGALLAQAEHSYLTPIKNTLTGIYDGTPVSRALAKGRSKTISIAQKPRLSIFGAVTSGYLSRHSEPVDWTDGFFARFIILKGERARHNDNPVQDVPESRSWLVGSLRERASWLTAQSCLGIHPEALSMWRKWTALVDETQARAPKEVAGAIGRSNGHVLKIALLLAWDAGDNRREGSWTLEAKHLEPAMEIVRIHQESVFAIGEELAGTRDMNDRQAVLQAVSETPVPLGVITRRSRLIKERVLTMLGTLMEEKLVEKVDMQEGTTVVQYWRRSGPSGEGMPSNVIRLHPGLPPAPPMSSGPNNGSGSYEDSSGSLVIGDHD